MEYLRDVALGEILVIDENGPKSYYPFKRKPQPLNHCIFEFIYFERPDSLIFQKNVYEVWKNLGINLYRKYPLSATLLCSSQTMEPMQPTGYALESGIPIRIGMIRNHYIGITLIQPSEKLRDLSVIMKLNPIKEFVLDKEAIAVDDSPLRGTISKKRTKSIKLTGAINHFLISCPPLKFLFFFCIDFPKTSELIASKHTVEEIRKFLDIDTFYYLGLEELLDAVGNLKDKVDLACLTENYPLRGRFHL